MLTGRKLLILGANSFAGTCVLRAALKAGMTVVGISRSTLKSNLYMPDMPQGMSGYRFLQRDINNDAETVAADLRAFDPEYIVDLAGQGMVAESWGAPDQWYQTNLASKSRLLEEIRRLPRLKKYVRASTPEVYGNTERPIDETAPYKPSTPYAVSHAAIDMHIAACVPQYGLPAVIARFSNFYGPGQQLYRIIPRAILYAKTARKLLLQGGGQSTRAFIYQDDIGEAFLAALLHGQIGQVYHFSTRNFVTIRDLVGKIYDLIGVDFGAAAVETADRPGKDMRYLMKDDKARTELGWQDKFSLEQGLQQTIIWVHANQAALTNEPLSYVHKK